MDNTSKQLLAFICLLARSLTCLPFVSKIAISRLAGWQARLTGR